MILPCTNRNTRLPSWEQPQLADRRMALPACGVALFVDQMALRVDGVRRIIVATGSDGKEGVI